MKLSIHHLQLVVLSLFLALSFVTSSAHAAALQSNMPATYVLGQPDFTTSDAQTTNTSTTLPDGIAVDEVHHRLFVSDVYRVLVYDISGGVSTNMSAVHVLGQLNFTDKVDNLTDDSHFNGVEGLAYDPNHDYLFVSDYTHSRVLVFDVATVTDGESAIHVIGQNDFSGNTVCKGGDLNSLGQSCIKTPNDLYYDPVTNYLYVSDDHQRLMVFDTSAGITDGMNASYVLGQPDFTSGNSSYGLNAIGFNYVKGIAVDTADHLLFVASNSQDRVMVFDTSSGLSNGMSAVHVLGQPDLVTSGSNTTQNGMGSSRGVWFDPGTKRLFVADEGNNRVLVYDISSGVTDGMNASYVLGQPDFITSTSNSQGQVVHGPKGDSFLTCSQCMASPRSVVYSSSSKLLFVGDGNNRVLVFDLSALPASIAYNGSFNENGADNGTLTGSRTATLTNDTFVNPGSTLTYGIHYTLSNVPGGLTPVMTVSNDGTQAVLTFTGAATAHDTGDSVTNLTITFLNGAFVTNATASDVTNYSNTSGEINFITNTPTPVSTPVGGGIVPIGCTDKQATNYSSNAVINSGCVYAVGTNLVTLPAGCVPGYAFSSTTGASCISGSSSSGAPAKHIFTKILKQGMNDSEVFFLQQYLNAHGFPVALSGVGSAGHETNFFGAKTAQALAQFQQAHADAVLKSAGLTKGTGYFGSLTMKFVNAN